MELRVEEVKLPEVIAFNYDELKAELTEKVKTYETMVYTEKQIKEADNKRKEAKQIEIGSLFVCQEFPSWVRLPMIFDESWLNAGTSMKQIEDNLIGWKNRIEAELATLASLPDFSFEATEVYKQTLDLNKAIAEGRRLADIQKRKQEGKGNQRKENRPPGVRGFLILGAADDQQRQKQNKTKDTQDRGLFVYDQTADRKGKRSQQGQTNTAAPRGQTSRHIGSEQESEKNQ